MAKRNLRQEVIKQLIDQPLHFGWAFLSTLPAAYALSTSQPLIPIIVLIIIGLISIAAIILREVGQWPSSRWWDPWLDWLFFIFGGLTGIYIGLTWTN